MSCRSARPPKTTSVSPGSAAAAIASPVRTSLNSCCPVAFQTSQNAIARTAESRGPGHHQPHRPAGPGGASRPATPRTGRRRGSAAAGSPARSSRRATRATRSVPTSTDVAAVMGGSSDHRVRRWATRAASTGSRPQPSAITSRSSQARCSVAAVLPVGDHPRRIGAEAVDGVPERREPHPLRERPADGGEHRDRGADRTARQQPGGVASRQPPGQPRRRGSARPRRPGHPPGSASARARTRRPGRPRRRAAGSGVVRRPGSAASTRAGRAGRAARPSPRPRRSSGSTAVRSPAAPPSRSPADRRPRGPSRAASSTLSPHTSTPSSRSAVCPPARSTTRKTATSDGGRSTQAGPKRLSGCGSQVRPTSRKPASSARIGRVSAGSRASIATTARVGTA